MPTVGSLFSGVGGFDLAFERAGFKVAYQVEFDKHARSVLRKHWPDTILFEDVRDVNAAKLPAVDVLAGGFPCQDLSVAGRRAGLAGERSGLFYEFARIIEESHPEWVVIENVPGLLSSRGGRDMGAILGTLSELGYGWAYRVLDSQYFGVPQRRRRVFIVGRTGARSRDCAEVLFEPESVLGNPPPSRAQGEKVAGSLGGGAGNRGWCDDLDRAGAFVNVSPTLTGGAEGRGFRGDDGSNAYVLSIRGRTGGSQVEIEREGVAPVLRGGGGGSSRGLMVFAENQRGSAGGGKSGSGYPAIFAIQDGREIEKRQNGLGIGGDIAYTLDGTGAQGVSYVPEQVGALSDGAHHGGGLNGQDAYSGRVLAPTGTVRRLTPKECERLQGFPDDWTAGQADSHRYRQMGNAVTVPVVEWIASRLLRQVLATSAIAID